MKWASPEYTRPAQIMPPNFSKPRVLAYVFDNTTSLIQLSAMVILISSVAKGGPGRACTRPYFESSF